MRQVVGGCVRLEEEQVLLFKNKLRKFFWDVSSVRLCQVPVLRPGKGHSIGHQGPQGGRVLLERREIQGL